MLVLWRFRRKNKKRGVRAAHSGKERCHLRQAYKAGPEDSGLYLAPAYEKGDVPDDESGWIACTSLVRQNSPRKPGFYLPDEAAEGSSYRIAVKSTYLNGAATRKEPVYTYSDVVTIVAA
ncbi:MAG: DUF4469 domain-containing protein [Treponema sp.]|nr:DUF4469 domain-containing protein [Treponema sp.]